MKLLSLDGRNTLAVVQIFSAEDLWRLTQVLEEGDTVTGRTERKIKVNEDTVVRKALTLTILVEKTELQGDLLRISGVTTENMDDIPKGSHHTINVAVHDVITIKKDFQSWQIEKLREEDAHPILVLLMDREEATFALLKREPEILSTIKGSVQKKGMDGGSPYWEELARELAVYDERINPQHIIIASPAFFKEYVINVLPEQLKKKTVGATISATGEAALAELVRRTEVKHVLAQERYTQELLFIDQIMEGIRHDKAAYGFNEVLEVVNVGNASLLVITTEYMKQCRSVGTYSGLAELMQNAERMKTTVHLLETSAAAQIDKLGGIAAVKRW